MRVLVVSARHPCPPNRGDARRLLHLVRGLAAQADVVLCCFGTGSEPPIAGVRVRTVIRSWRSVAQANVRHADPRLPLQVRLFLDRRLERLVAEEVRAFRPDVVHASTARMAPYLDGTGAARRHLDLIDALSLNMAEATRGARVWRRPAYRLESHLLQAYEARAVAAASTASLVSGSDRRARGLAGAAIVPNGVDAATFAFMAPEERLPVLLFFGNLGYVHNVPAARFVASEVLPRVRAELPAASLRLAGARPVAGIRRLHGHGGVEVAADVPSIVDELHGAAVAVLPILSGSGIKNKVLEAFAAGTPVVTNAQGIRGIEGAVAGRHYAAGETADELAAACLRLLRDPAYRRRLADAAAALISERYSWERQVQALRDLYRPP
jgi:glycosyltransferase involved in cell wall biosynthesis